MKYLYTNITKRSHSISLVSADGTKISNIFLTPHETITLDYPGLNHLVPEMLRLFVDKAVVVQPVEEPVEIPVETKTEVPMTEPTVEDTVKVPVDEPVKVDEVITIEETEEVDEVVEGIVVKKRVGRIKKV
jgi:hypothetical protein